MEIKNNQRIIVSGRTVCLVAGIIAMLCSIHWIVRALMFDDTNLPAMLSAITADSFSPFTAAGADPTTLILPMRILRCTPADYPALAAIWERSVRAPIISMQIIAHI